MEQELTKLKRVDKSKSEYTSWVDIRKKYPDSFVLLENPIYHAGARFPEKGIFRYKNKSKRKVAEKANEFDIKLMTIIYTGGRLEKEAKDCIFIL